MKWKIEKFTVKLGDDLLDSYLYHGSCVAQILCESQKITPYQNFFGHHRCWICFVDGTPPENVKDDGVIIQGYDDEWVYPSESVLFLNIHQYSIADCLAIVTTNEAYINVADDYSNKRIQLIAEISPPEIESTEPPYGALNVDINTKEIKITFDKYIHPAKNYDNISLIRVTPKSKREISVPIIKTIDKYVLSIKPKSPPFSRGSKYILNIPENSIESRDAGYIITQSYKLSFTTII